MDSGDTPCHFRCSCEGPNASRSLTQWVDWAGQRPEGRTPTPTPSRKKERECMCMCIYIYTSLLSLSLYARIWFTAVRKVVRLDQVFDLRGPYHVMAQLSFRPGSMKCSSGFEIAFSTDSERQLEVGKCRRSAEVELRESFPVRLSLRLRASRSSDPENGPRQPSRPRVLFVHGRDPAKMMSGTLGSSLPSSACLTQAS